MITLRACRYGEHHVWYVNTAHIVSVSRGGEPHDMTVVQISTGRDAWGTCGGTLVAESPDEVMALIRANQLPEAP